MSAYLSVEIMDCVRAGHRFTIAGSDKSPMKRNLICETCTDRNPGKTAYAAYGIDTLGFGAWPTRRRLVTEGEDNEYTKTAG